MKINKDINYHITTVVQIIYFAGGMVLVNNNYYFLGTTICADTFFTFLANTYKKFKNEI